MSDIYTNEIDYYGEKVKLLNLPFEKPTGDSPIEKWVTEILSMYSGYEHMYTASEIGDIQAPDWYTNQIPIN